MSYVIDVDMETHHEDVSMYGPGYTTSTYINAGAALVRPHGEW